MYSLHKAMVFDVHPPVNTLIRAILGIQLILICEVLAHATLHPDAELFSREKAGKETEK